MLRSSSGGTAVEAKVLLILQPDKDAQRLASRSREIDTLMTRETFVKVSQLFT